MNKLLPLAALSLAIGAALPLAFAAAPASGPSTTTAPTSAPARRGRGAPTGPYAPTTLPGKNLAQYNFFYAGEHAPLELFIIKDGKVAWQYTHPKPARGAGEISDATMLPNGNILFAFQFGAAEVNPDKKVVWSYEATAPYEIHTAQAIGDDKVVLIENGTPPKLLVLKKSDNSILTDWTLPCSNPNSIHLQFRSVRLTPNGNFLVSHMDMGKVVEYDKDAKEPKEVWSVAVQAPWSATRLATGNTLIASNNNFAREVNPKGETVWEFRPADAPEYRFFNTQTAVRMKNGDTLINNWHGKDANGTPVQAVEVTPEKKVVWALQSFADPNLGNSTIIQILDDNAKP